MSISKEIERIQQAKKDIGDAIVRKGGSVSGTIDTYAKSVMALGDVSFRTAIDIVNKSDAKNVDLTMISPKNETSLAKVFFKNDKLVSVDVSNWDTSNITDFTQAFSVSHNLESIDVSNWNTSNGVTFFAMFDEGYKISTLDVSKWDMSSAEIIDWMFCRCQSITSLDLSGWDTSKVTSAHHLFAVCPVELIDLSGVDFTQVTNMYRAFNENHHLSVIKCTGLKLPNIELSGIGLNFSPLTVDSIVGLLNALPQSDKGYSFQIGSTNIAKLSDEQKAIATDKGWTLI